MGLTLAERRERVRSDHLDRMWRVAWPTVEGFLHAVLWRDKWGSWQITCRMVDNFDLSDLSDEDRQRVFRSVDRAFHREMRRLWTREQERRADEKAERVTPRPTQETP